ncbi:phage/plasmid primase, P4 family [Mycoplasmatota bacterium WC44]
MADNCEYMHESYDGKKMIIKNKLALELVNEYNLVKDVESNDLYIYKGNHYQILSSDSLSKLMYDFLISVGLEEQYTRIRNEVMEYVKILAKPTSELRQPNNYINLKNCFIGIDENNEIVVREHTKDLYFAYCLNCNYEPTATAPRFEQFLNEIFLNDIDKIQHVKEKLAYTALPFREVNRDVITAMVSSGSSGKSVTLKAVSAFLPDSLTSSFSLNQLDKDSNVARLKDVYVNISSESKIDYKTNIERLKAIASGDSIEVDRKFKSTLKFTPKVRFIFATNHSVKTSDLSNGFTRRFKFINFPRTFTPKESDPFLSDTLKGETDGIFLSLLKAYLKFRRNGFNFTYSETVEKFNEDIIEDYNIVRRFASSCITKKNGAHVEYKEIVDAFNKFCDESSERNYFKGREFHKLFRQELNNMSYKNVKRRKSSSKTYYEGIELVTVKTDDNKINSLHLVKGDKLTNFTLDVSELMVDEFELNTTIMDATLFGNEIVIKLHVDEHDLGVKEVIGIKASFLVKKKLVGNRVILDSIFIKELGQVQLSNDELMSEWDKITYKLSSIIGGSLYLKCKKISNEQAIVTSVSLNK